MSWKKLILIVSVLTVLCLLGAALLYIPKYLAEEQRMRDNSPSCSKYRDFLEEATSSYNECEWEFPKGRRNNYETDLACACREFTEETNIDIKNISITNHKYFEHYKSNNNNNYLHVYYLAFLKNKSLILDKEPCTEINKISWYTYSDALRKIRNYSVKKKDLLKVIEKYLNL